MSHDMYGSEALSKTAKYKKITKPLLERKRRARINRCLDELKELMVGALEIDDDNMSKLEKADILELTVNHLTKLHSPRDPAVEAKKFQAGFGQCAAEACRFILSIPDLDAKVSENLIGHLSRLVASQPLTIQVPDRQFSPPMSPPSPLSERRGYYSDQDRSMSDGDDTSAYDNVSQHSANTWNQRHVQVPQPIRSPLSNKQSTPLNSLLTTVDKVGNQRNEREMPYKRKSHGYFNKVPAEAKDAILQKIRQHIMEKQNNNSHPQIDMDMHREYVQHSQKYAYQHEDPVNYYVPNEHQEYAPNQYIDTLDLRKARLPKTSPAKYQNHIEQENFVVERAMPPMISPISSVVSDNSIEQRQHKPNVEATKEETDLTSVSRKSNKLPLEVRPPVHEEMPIDYSNLPPKKKRKLIEYQEYKKQEELRRIAEKCALADDGSAWRPW